MRQFIIGTLLALPLAALGLPQKASADILVTSPAPVTKIAQVNIGIGIWIPGYWGYDRGRRYWVPGRYDRSRYWDRDRYDSRYWDRGVRDRDWDRRWDKDRRDNWRWDRDRDNQWDGRQNGNRDWDTQWNGRQNGNRDR
ncbi:MAG: hypothetical protein WCA35_31855 [Kovacikia sp.]